MTAEDVEQQIRRHPTANERFLLGLLDEARAALAARDEPYRVQPPASSLRSMREVPRPNYQWMSD